MATPRSNHAAILLGNGNVMVCGGSKDNRIGGVLSSAELYGSALGFRPTGSMTTPRAGHSATLLRNGRVLIVGGISEVGPRTQLAGAELYDPASGTFSPTGSMATPRAGHTATLLPDGRVLVAGGSPNGVVTIASAEIYDPASGAFSYVGEMTVPREAHSATLLRSGKVLIAGGGRRGRPGIYIAYDVAEIFDPETNGFSFAGTMISDRAGHTATLLNDGDVLLAGGRGSRVTGVRGGNIRGLSGLKVAEIYNVELHKFRPVGDMHAYRFLQTATLLGNGQVLMAGGWNVTGPVPGGMKNAELYDPRTQRFYPAGDMQTPRVTHTATLLPDGEVLMVGGVDASGNVVSSSEFYWPAQHRFLLQPATMTAREPHAN